jgi:predicted nucleotidyltransferase
MLQESLPKLKEHLDLKLVVLFGSYATGRFTAASDVDLLVVYEGPERDDVYALCKKTLGVPRLEPHVYSAGLFAEMKESIKPMIQKGVVLIDSLHV